MNHHLIDKPQRTILPGGLPLLTITRPESPTLALRLYVRAGSRYDVEFSSATHPLGLAHLTEHMLFHGPGMQRRLAQVEQLGGLLQAETSKEYCRFTAVTPPEGLASSVRVLSELVNFSHLSDAALMQEKMTVMQELARRKDSYSIIFDHFAALIWPGHSLSHPILGTEEGLQEITQEAIEIFFNQRYVSGNALLVACGAVDRDELERLAAEYFYNIATGAEQPPLTFSQPGLEFPRREHIEKKTHQSHLLIGVPTVGMKHADRSGLKVIERVLGMGASGRLYQRLRNRERLVYDVRTITAQYEDAGYFAVYTACAPEAVDQVRHAILEEWDAICEEGINPEELRAAQSNYAGTLARKFETNLALAGIIGVETLLHHQESMAEAIKRINAVQSEEVQHLARNYLGVERTVSVSIGPKVETNA